MAKEETNEKYVLYLIVAFIVIALGVTVYSLLPERTSAPTRQTISAPDFSIINAETRGVITLSDFQGKPVLIHFFASWCPRCQNTASNVANYYDSVNGGFNVLLVSVDPRATENDLISFKQNYGRSTWKVAQVSDSMQNAYNVQSLDTKYVVNSEGIISHNDNRMWSFSDAQTYLGGV